MLCIVRKSKVFTATFKIYCAGNSLLLLPVGAAQRLAGITPAVHCRATHQAAGTAGCLPTRQKCVSFALPPPPPPRSADCGSTAVRCFKHITSSMWTCLALMPSAVSSKSQIPSAESAYHTWSTDCSAAQHANTIAEYQEQSQTPGSPKQVPNCCGNIAHAWL